MASVNTSFCSGENTGKVLLIGDISKAFLDAGAITQGPYEVYRNLPEAIEAAAKNSFSAIGVVMAGMSAKLYPTLKALKDNCDAKIILLAQMSEEPMAIQLTGPGSQGTGLADDYLICPLQADRFYEFLTSMESYQATEAVLPAAVDTSIEKKIRLLEKLATEDDLTGLKNRRYIWEFARQIIAHAQKTKGRVTLLVFDIDNLKLYNDLYGHLAGDEVLRQAAILIKRCCRGHDVVGRIGGDEFAVVFWDDPQLKFTSNEGERRSAMAEHPREAICIAKRFIKELEKAEFNLLGSKGKGVLTISGGLASFPRDGSTIGQLFQQADKALLEAKRSGKNRIYLVGKPQSDIADIE